MIICTENDKDFYKYKDKINSRKVNFTIRQIFSNWWNKFLEAYTKIKIRNVVYFNVNKMLKCKTWDLGYSLFKCPECGKLDPVPSFVVNEQLGFLKFINKKKSFEMECSYCGKPSFPIYESND